MTHEPPIDPPPHPLDDIDTVDAEHEECGVAFTAEPIEYDFDSFIVECPDCRTRIYVADEGKTA